VTFILPIKDKMSLSQS